MNKDDTRTYLILAALAVSLIAIGTTFYHIVEGFNWLDSYYFSVITLTTVGYGDFTPHTNLGKLFTTVYVLFGAGIVTTFVTYSLKRRSDKIHQRLTHIEAHAKKHQQTDSK